MEKSKYLIEEGSPPQVQRRRPAAWKWVVTATLLVSIPLFKAKLPLPSRCSHHDNHPTRLTYPGERITWERCGDLGNRPLECSSIDVPMDQFSPSNSGNKTFSIPLIRLRGANATQNLFLNPGGPGGSGIEFLYRKGAQLHDIVGEGFHLLSFDPRGINSSQPLARCYPDAETQRERSSVRDTKIIEDSIEAYTWSHNFVRACADTMGEHGLYLNTPQTAADMNSILDALGQDNMVYWGFSYGSLLGQTYATMFPDRSERVIIDGVANQFDWYEGLLDTETFVDTENVWEGFLEECIKAGKDCALSSLAESKDSLKAKFYSLAQQLKDSPLSVYVNNTIYGTIDYETIWYNAIFPALYKPANWYPLAERLAQLLEGNATEALISYGLGDPWGIAGQANEFITYNDGASGASFWPQDRESTLDVLIPYMNSSIFAPTEYGGYYIKQQWQVPKTHEYVPRVGVETAHPVLILSTTYDPVCPLQSARSANAAFKDSQIVEVLGYGHCSVAIPSTCLAKHVRAFLYDGTVPDSYTQCEVDGKYFINPDEGGKVTAQKHFDDLEEQKIHLAQIELARNWDW
ncbi:alpha/beta-hydrolase [Annulohypoxylon maeteangense]|uniref:alpha/beta-hydrolase n=1 Tax=Annulohypoxylon maeteangense TaxID=1927788 RepID=UPI0020085B2A|nr:alpha/beta-hydrolase [Annulohypoxylon maeteangense]KAI0889611.1 alpha/beta-hydrolase [Annulohypoxylon maeteangense]